MASRHLILGISFLLCSLTSLAQTIHIDSGYTWRAYTGMVTPPTCGGGTDKLCHYYPTQSWEANYKEFAAWQSANGNPNSASAFMNFRVMFPPGYNKNDTIKKYPVILFLHGAGESGRVWQGRFNYLPDNPLYDNNSRSTIHGGNEHKTAVLRPITDPRAFPGIVIFPQVSYSGAWSDSWNNGTPSPNQEFVYAFLEHIIASYNGDINRIAVHGLSNGAKGTWDTAMKRPDLFSAVQPFSGTPYEPTVAADILVTTAIRLYQGGLDKNPSPGGAQTTINAFTNLGGNPEYFLYPNLGHNVWTTAMARADFFSWILAQDKRKIYIFGGSNALCDEPGATKKLGFSAGFLAYQWTKNGTNIPGATTRYLTTSEVGTYTVKFKRKDLQWYESFPTTIVNQGSSTYSPELTNSGSLILPYTKDDGTFVGSIGQTKTILEAPAGFSEYTWYKDNNLLSKTTSNTRQISSNYGSASDAGYYSVSVQESSGCESLLSDSLTLVYNSNAINPPNTTGPWHTSPTGTSDGVTFTAIGTPILTALSENKMLITWTDNVPDEEYFEIWRYRKANATPIYPNQANYVMIAKVPANTTSYIDQVGLRPLGQYTYRVRAIADNDGRFSQQPSYKAILEDFQAPTAPTDLEVTNVTSTSVTLSWTPASDNDVIYRYAMYLGTGSVGFSQVYDTLGDYTDGNPAPSTSYTFTGLEPNTSYTFNVRAIDFRGNQSGFPQAVTATTSPSVNGLNYKYYLGTWDAIPDFASLTPNKTGIVPLSGTNAFDVSPRTRTDNYGFVFEGLIQIMEGGVHGFTTKSDDGSKLFINNTLVVNNDNLHGPVTVPGSFDFPLPGLYPIRVEYFEKEGSGEMIEVQYTPPSEGLQFIPLSRLFVQPPAVTTFYSKSTGNLESLSTWGTNTNGNGTPPANFTTANQYFEIRNRTPASLDNAWTVSGTSSRVIVGEGVTLTLNAPLSAKVYANAGSTINLANAVMPSLVQLDPTSTVNMNVAGTVPQAIYGNLNLKTNSTTKTLPTSSTKLQGSLTVDSGVTLAGNPVNESTLSVGGSITFNGTSGTPPANSNRYSLLLSGAGNHAVSTNGTDLSLYSLELDLGATGTLNFNSPGSAKTITLGTANGSGGLILRTGSQLIVGNNNLVINGALGANPGGDNGEVSITGGTITMATSATQSNLAFSPGNNLVYDLSLNLGSNGKLTLLNGSQLRNLMSLNSGTVTIADNLKLLSDSTGTSRIGPIASGSRISGNVTAQRYVDGEGRIYRYISSPVKGATVQALQTYFPVTGNFTGASVIPGVTSGTSMWHYVDPAYQAFPPAGGTNLDTLRRGKGYSPYIREATMPTTWELTGEIYQGTIPFTVTGVSVPAPEGWNLLGNPYPAPIKWNGTTGGGWTVSGFSNTVYVRENSNGTTQVKTHNGSTGSNGWISGVIAPGQAFWVKAIAASPSLTVSESAKQTIDAAFYRTGAPENTLSITLRSSTLQDETIIQLVPGATTAFDAALDAVKLDNSYFNLSSLTSDGKPMVFNLTTPDFCEQEIALRTSNISPGTYQLEINGVTSILSGDKVTLIDHFTQTEKVISDSESYSFSVTSDPASKADGRFTMRLQKPVVTLNQTLQTAAGCEETSPKITVENSQPGVSYQGFVNGSAVTTEMISAGGTLELEVDPALLNFGATPVKVMAGFKGCDTFELPVSINVQRDTLAVPTITAQSGGLIASTENAQYQWFYNGVLIENENERELAAQESGIYAVEVTLGSCVKKSDSVEYVITGIESQRERYTLYPNPTRNKVVVTTQRFIDLNTVHVITTLGQPLTVPKNKLSDESAELDFSALPVGFYLIEVGHQRFRVIKE